MFESAQRYPACILSGGQSRRFGRDKARVELPTGTLIEHVERELRAAVDDAFAVAATDGQYADLGIHTLGDQMTDQGPLGGLHAGLVYARDDLGADWIWLASCDQTQIRCDWLAELLSVQQSGTNVRAVVFAQPPLESAERSMLHPFPGLFHVSLIGSIEQRLQSEQRALQQFLHDPATCAAYVPLPLTWPPVPQINTAENLAAWKRAADFPGR